MSRYLLLALALFVSVAESGVGPAFELKPACGEKLGDEKFEVIAKLSAAVKGRKWDEVIPIKQRLIADNCANVKSWLELAEFFLEMKERAKAISVLDELVERGVETVPEVLAQTSLRRLKKLVTEPEFLKAETYQKLYFHSLLRDKRREEFLATLRGLGVREVPAEKELKKTVCPYNCCKLGDWTSTKETPLFGSPEGNKVVATVAQDETVKSLEAEYRGRPQPVGVLIDVVWPGLEADKKPGSAGEIEFKFKKGEILFLLEPVGDGFHRVYAQRRYALMESTAIQSHCRSPGASCWGETLDNQGDSFSQWWVKVKRSQDRGEGWTNGSVNFLRGCD